MKMAQVVGVAIAALAIATLALSAINLGLYWKVVELPTWLSLRAYVHVVGVVSLLAAIAAVLPGGWTRWAFAFLFGFIAYRLLYVYASILTDYPTRAYPLLGLVGVAILFAFGSIHLMFKAKHWLG